MTEYALINTNQYFNLHQRISKLKIHLKKQFITVFYEIFFRACLFTGCAMSVYSAFNNRYHSIEKIVA